MTHLPSAALVPLRAAAASILLAISLSATAQTQKPGLWEMTTKVQSGGQDMGAAMAKMQKQLESMPPDQRKMLEDMMAKQGVQMGSSGGGGVTVKICMTKEMFDQAHMAKPSEHCTHSISPRSGNTQRFTFSCTQPPSQGQGEVTYLSPEAYTTKMTGKNTVGGKESTMDMQSSGRWLGSDCGNIKPFKMPAKP
jgi:hypothetical protein